MTHWLSVSEIAGLLSITRQRVHQRVDDEHWRYRTFDGNGGKQKRFRIADLPEDVQQAYAASLEMTFEALRNELKPKSEAPVKYVIEGYKGYGSAQKVLKPEGELGESDRQIASLRAQVLQAYGALDMKVADFARAYTDGLIVTDIRARLIELSPRDATLSKSKLYEWLERFSQGGVIALARQHKDRGGAGASLTQEQKDRLEWLWLDPNKP